MGAPLVQTQTVLEFEFISSDHRTVRFAPPKDPPPDPTVAQRATHVDLDTEVWDDMSRPDAITVTIQPGDKLNDEA